MTWGMIMARILEQGPMVVIAAAAPVEKIKADDTRFANRGGRMAGVHAARGDRKASAWFAATCGRGSRLSSETVHGGTNTPSKGRGGNYRAK